MKLTDKKVLWVDCGLFCDFAAHVAPQFGESYYFTPWVSGFPKSTNVLPGEGLDGLTRVKFPWDLVDQVDLFIFPDVYFADWQAHLAKLGKRVWGARHGDGLELYRWETKQLLMELGLPVAPTVRLVGVQALRDYLKEHEGVWVKVSTMRGDFETFKSESYELAEPQLDDLEHKLGARKLIEEFIVENEIRSEDGPTVEIGYDGWCIDGQFPATASYGIEVKDMGYIGAVAKYRDFPAQLIEVNDALIPFFKKHTYRGFFSSELRITPDGLPYLIDPCARCGSPPSEVYQCLFENWAEIFWGGAGGTIVEPEPLAKFAVEAMIHSAWADQQFQAVHFPEAVREWVKLRNHCRIEGTDYVVPTATGLPEIGAVVGVGDTLSEAIAHCAKNASLIKGYTLECKMDSIGQALDQIRDAHEIGINFPVGELPTPEELKELITVDEVPLEMATSKDGESVN